MAPSDNETLLIDAGDDVVQKEVERGRGALTAFERLVHRVWVADYSMRNAGDLLTASDLYAPFQEEAAQLADALGLARIRAAFSLPAEKLERAYFEAFDDLCIELQGYLSSQPELPSR